MKIPKVGLSVFCKRNFLALFRHEFGRKQRPIMIPFHVGRRNNVHDGIKRYVGFFCRSTEQIIGYAGTICAAPEPDCHVL